MKIRYTLCVLLFFLVISVPVVKAFDISNYNDFVEQIIYAASEKITYYMNIASCSPYIYNNGISISEVVGREGSKCHVKIKDKDCMFPMHVAKKYGKNSAQYNMKIVENIELGKGLTISYDDKTLKDEQMLQNKYCTIPEKN